MKQTFLLLSFLIAVSFANLVDLDAVLNGPCDQISDKSLPVLDLAANLTIKPINVSATDVDNKNNTILKALNTTQILAKLTEEIELRGKELQFDALFLNLSSGFDQLKVKLDSVINLILDENDCNDPTIIDFALVARQHLRGLLARYKARKLAKYLRWYSNTNDFRLRRVTIRDLRVQIIDTLKNASVALDSVVSGGCVGLNLLGLPCLRLNLLGVLNLLPTINNMLNSLLSVQNNLNNLTTSYNNDLALVQDIFTDLDLLDEGDNADYQLVLENLQRKRNFELPTWDEVVANLEELLGENNLMTLKGRVRKLLVGWKFGNNDDTLTLNTLTDIARSSNIISLEFVTTLVRDTACGCALADTVQDAAIKLQAAIKTVLQTSCLLDRINVEDAIVNVADNVTKVVYHIRAFEIENNRLISDILAKANIDLPDPDTYQSEFNSFVQNLTTDPSIHINVALQQFTLLRADVETENNKLNVTIGALIVKKEELVNSALLELKNFTANITTLLQFTESLVNRYIQSANQTYDGLKASSDCYAVSVKEALAKIEIIKHQALVAAVQWKNATDAKVKNALNQTVENLKIQLWETFQDREVKKECNEQSNEATNSGYGDVEPEHANLVDNLNSIKSSTRKRLQVIKEKIRQNYLGFENSIAIAVRAYRPSLVNITIIAGADLDINNDISLTVNVDIEDAESEEETDDERRKAHICILRAIFAAITTDVNVSVVLSPSAKRSSNDAYTVSSSTPMSPTTPVPVSSPTPVASPTPTTPTTPTPVATPTPVTTPVTTPVDPTPVDPTPTSGTLSIVMSLAAMIACSMFLVL